jgi:hypothetical protein
LLERARHTSDAAEFIREVELGNFCSNNTRKKLETFKVQLKAANKGDDVTEEELYQFLKHFHLLNYDLAKEKGIVLSLLQSHISQFNNDTSPHSIWCEILAEVQNFNQNAGTITLDTLPDDLVEYFKPKARDHIPVNDRQKACFLTPAKTLSGL